MVSLIRPILTAGVTRRPVPSMRQRVLKKILSAALPICLLVGYSDGPLWGVSGSRSLKKTLAACQGTVTCCCKATRETGGHSCGMEGAAGRDAGVPSSRSGCQFRPANCDPVTGVPQPTVTKNLTSPLPLAGLSYFPREFEDIPPAASAHLSCYKSSVFRPPRS